MKSKSETQASETQASEMRASRLYILREFGSVSRLIIINLLKT
ncbi:hypothetical protein QUF82_10990 [Thiotrichales bacterium HSG14]|nr:hypothetical protein [Thiotrichales bacterium HSG14]